MLKDKVDVSVILCAYNEGKVIWDTIARVDDVMRGLRLNYEIVVVDDGSEDETRQKAVKYMEERGNGMHACPVLCRLGWPLLG
ncbi:MAG: glycosyltransferase [Candidatus Bathyarchaeales archaeon]